MQNEEQKIFKLNKMKMQEVISAPDTRSKLPLFGGWNGRGDNNSHQPATACNTFQSVEQAMLFYTYVWGAGKEDAWPLALACGTAL